MSVTTVLALLVTLPLVAQAEGRQLDGSVVDNQGKPVAGATVIFRQFGEGSRLEPPAAPQTETDSAGRFHLAIPKSRSNNDVSSLWVYRPGLALAALSIGDGLTGSITLKMPEPRTITIEAPDGKPIAGAQVAPRYVVFALANVRTTRQLPHELAQALTVTTGADGKATFNFVARLDQLDGAYVTTRSTGRQYFPLRDQPAQRNEWTMTTIRMKPTSRLVGTLHDAAGKGVSGQPVEIWSKAYEWDQPSAVEFENGPVHTAADGSFQTPDSLLAGVSYRAVIRAPGMERIFSEWFTASERPRVLPPVTLRPLRSVRGRVVDRQGRAVAGVEVLQSGDGPERTRTMSDASGRFTLGGYSRVPAFVFAHGAGFRFTGQLIKPGEGESDVTLAITRLGEPPAGPMRMLPDPIPLEESRALARWLMEPEWKSLDAKNDTDKNQALRALVPIDPFAVLRKLDAVKLPGPQMKNAIWLLAAETLASVDAAEAETLAETIDEPSMLARALLYVADGLPETDRAHKLALLERVTVQGRNSSRLPWCAVVLARVIARLSEMGEKAKAQALVPEAIKLSKETGTRADIAAELARADPAAALALATEVATRGPDFAAVVFTRLARRVAIDAPAEAERIWNLIPSQRLRDSAIVEVTWKIAEADPQSPGGSLRLPSARSTTRSDTCSWPTSCGRATRPVRGARFKRPWRVLIAGSTRASLQARCRRSGSRCPWSSKSTPRWCRSISGGSSPCGPHQAIPATGACRSRTGSRSWWDGTTVKWPMRSSSPCGPHSNEAMNCRPMTA